MRERANANIRTFTMAYTFAEREATAKQLTTKLCVWLLRLLPWEFGADPKGRAENDVSSWDGARSGDEQAAATPCDIASTCARIPHV